MQRWEYQTLIVRLGREKFIEIIQLNGVDVTALDFHPDPNEAVYPDLPSFLSAVGHDGWEVTGTSPLTSASPVNGIGDGRLKVMIILKRPLEQ